MKMHLSLALLALCRLMFPSNLIPAKRTMRYFCLLLLINQNHIQRLGLLILLVLKIISMLLTINIFGESFHVYLCRIVSRFLSVEKAFDVKFLSA